MSRSAKGARERLDYDLVGLTKFNLTNIHADCVEHIVHDDKGQVGQKWFTIRKLGEGSSGTVWLQRAGPDAEKALRAVKEIKKDRQGYYKTEIAALSKFSTKFLHVFAHFQGWYEDGKSVFLAQEYLEYGDLEKYMTTPFPEYRIKSIASQLLDGIAILHAENFTHRDLKPQNILVASISPSWRVKIADFGCAKRVQTDHANMNTLIGTIAYRAPEISNYFEQTHGLNNYTGAVDVWSLGCIIFELFTGSLPFGKQADRLKDYCTGKFAFPTQQLRNVKTSQLGIDLIQSFLDASPDERPSAIESLDLEWLRGAQNSRQPHSQASLYAQQESERREQEVIEFLSLGGYNTNSRVSMSLALLKATSLGRRDVVYVALEKQADIERASSDGLRPLHLASQLGYLGIVGVLIAKGADVLAETARNNMQAIHFASKAGHLTIVDILLRNGADATCEDTNKWQPLHYAAQAGHEAIIKLLLQNRIDPNATEAQTGLKATDLAICNGHPLTALVLLDQEPNVEVIAPQGMRHIHFAAKAGLLPVVTALIDRGCSINVQDDEGNTAMHWAAKMDHFKIVELLIQQRAKMWILNNEAELALHLALNADSDEAAATLIEHGPSIPQANDKRICPWYAWALRYACMKNKKGVVRQLLIKKTPTEGKVYAKFEDDIEGKIPVVVAIHYGMIELARLLLEKGAAVDGGFSRSRRGRTPLNFAVRDRSVAGVRLLLDFGADMWIEELPFVEVFDQLSTFRRMIPFGMIQLRKSSVRTSDARAIRNLLHSEMTKPSTRLVFRYVLIHVILISLIVLGITKLVTEFLILQNDKNPSEEFHREIDAIWVVIGVLLVIFCTPIELWNLLVWSHPQKALIYLKAYMRIRSRKCGS